MSSAFAEADADAEAFTLVFGSAEESASAWNCTEASVDEFDVAAVFAADEASDSAATDASALVLSELSACAAGLAET